MLVHFVVGPTASGKSALAMKWAQENQGAIVNCDSIQLYQGLDIGSAKPSQEDFSKVPHFLFDVVSKGSEITAGEYTRLFFETVEKIKTDFQNIYVVGGTGFYFQAIEKGMYDIGAADEKIKTQVEEELLTEEGAQKLYQELHAKDPEAAKKISPNDHYRLGRAIEIIRTHGKSVTDIKKAFAEKTKPFPYPLKKWGIKLEKADLIPRVEKRTENMLEAGLIKEVENLIQEGFRDWSALQSVGYKECLEFVKGEISSEKELKEKIVMNTLRLAKKQRTWFQRDVDIQWLAANEINSSGLGS